MRMGPTCASFERLATDTLPLLLIIACLALSGCAWQSEALKVGEGTYQVSANASPARGGIT